MNKWRWHLTGPDGQRLASGEAYVSREECEKAVELTMASWIAEVCRNDGSRLSFVLPHSAPGQAGGMSNYRRLRPPGA